ARATTSGASSSPKASIASRSAFSARSSSATRRPPPSATAAAATAAPGAAPASARVVRFDDLLVRGLDDRLVALAVPVLDHLLGAGLLDHDLLALLGRGQPGQALEPVEAL